MASLWAKCVCEFIGTGFGVYVGEASIANALLPSAKGNGMGHGWISFAYGLAFFFPALFFGHISAVLNPAFCLALVVIGDMSVGEFFALSAAEMAGAFLGGVFNWLHWLPHFATVPEPPPNEPEEFLLRKRDALAPQVECSKTEFIEPDADESVHFASYNTHEKRLMRKVTVGEAVRDFLQLFKPSAANHGKLYTLGKRAREQLRMRGYQKSGDEEHSVELMVCSKDSPGDGIRRHGASSDFERNMAEWPSHHVASAELREDELHRRLRHVLCAAPAGNSDSMHSCGAESGSLMDGDGANRACENKVGVGAQQEKLSKADCAVRNPQGAQAAGLGGGGPLSGEDNSMHSTGHNTQHVAHSHSVSADRASMGSHMAAVQGSCGAGVVPNPLMQPDSPCFDSSSYTIPSTPPNSLHCAVPSPGLSHGHTNLTSRKKASSLQRPPGLPDLHIAHTDGNSSADGSPWSALKTPGSHSRDLSHSPHGHRLFYRHLKRKSLQAVEVEKQRVHALYEAAIIADQNAKLSIFATRPAIYAPLCNFLCEFLSTILLVDGILLIQHRAKEISQATGAIYLDAASPWYVGVFIVVLVLGIGGPTGLAVNPARDLGPRIAHAVLPIPNKGPSEWHYAWIPVFAPLLGGVVAALLYNVILLVI